MEEKIIDLVHKRGLQDSIVYSTFSALSLEKIRELDKEADTAILDTKVSDCLYKLKGGCGANALHPFWQGINLPKERLAGYSVRAWLSGHLYPEKPTGGRLDIESLENKGITDLILNEPEKYVE
jgi:glycerophosphoryl diester phosphodiesterase